MSVRWVWSPLSTSCLLPRVEDHYVPGTWHNAHRDVSCYGSSEKTDIQVIFFVSKGPKRQWPNSIVIHYPFLQPWSLGCWGMVVLGTRENFDFEWTMFETKGQVLILTRAQTLTSPSSVILKSNQQDQSQWLLLFTCNLQLSKNLLSIISNSDISQHRPRSLKEQMKNFGALTGVAHSNWQRTLSSEREWRYSRRSSSGAAHSSL